MLVVTETQQTPSSPQGEAEMHMSKCDSDLVGFVFCRLVHNGVLKLATARKFPVSHIPPSQTRFLFQVTKTVYCAFAFFYSWSRTE